MNAISEAWKINLLSEGFLQKYSLYLHLECVYLDDISCYLCLLTLLETEIAM